MQELLFKTNRAAYSDALSNIAAGDQIWAEVLNRQYHCPVTNATTTFKDDFEQILAETKRIQELELMATQDLINKGLSFNASIRDMLISVEDEEDFSDAVVSMNPTQEVNDEARYNITSTPMPVIQKGFNINWRTDFDYRRNTSVARAIRKIMVQSDNLVAVGNTNISVTFNGAQNVIRGYTTLPDRATTSIATAWTTATTSILADVKLMVTDMLNANKVGLNVPLTLYVPTAYWIPLSDQAFANKGDRTFLEQILRTYPNIKEVKMMTQLATNNVVLVAMDSQYVQLATAQAPIVVPHVKQVSIAPQDFTAYAVWVPILKTDSNSLTGIVHASV